MCVYVSVQYMCSPSCQDVLSLGNNLSRCFVFRQGGWCVCMCLSSTCVALVVKMCLLWATTCQDVSSLGRGASVCVYVSVQYICSPSCQDVSSLGNNLSRCFVFRQGG